MGPNSKNYIRNMTKKTLPTEKNGSQIDSKCKKNIVVKGHCHWNTIATKKKKLFRQRFLLDSQIATKTFVKKSQNCYKKNFVKKYFFANMVPKKTLSWMSMFSYPDLRCHSMSRWALRHRIPNRWWQRWWWRITKGEQCWPKDRWLCQSRPSQLEDL